MPSFQCPKCELLFAAEGELAWHLREDHRTDQERTPQGTVPQQPDLADGDAQATATGNGGQYTARRPRWWPPWRRSA
jgi:hypothetical protein